MEQSRCALHRGATTRPFIKQNYEIAGGIGGPIARDKLWYWSARRWISQSYQPGNYFNKTQGHDVLYAGSGSSRIREQLLQRGDAALTLAGG